MTEAFLMSIGEEADQYALDCCRQQDQRMVLQRRMGTLILPEMALDYYNSYVIHPMYIEVLETCKACGFWTPVYPAAGRQTHAALQRVPRTPDLPRSTYPAFGRSVVYRMEAFQTMAMAAWKYGLPEGNQQRTGA